MTIAEAVATVFWLGHVETFRVALAVGVTAPALWAARTLPAWARAASFLAILLAGLWASAVWAGATGLVDDGTIVIDEVAGAAFLLFLLVTRRAPVAAALLAVYVALDRLKPWPIGLTEEIPGALGVMVDDLAAALPVAVAALAARPLLRRLG
ncbi:phosphatidylglycerophosphatase A [Salinarimonas sp.]|uniref:phosphatidylglycerophosphatase A family protein n=1 Tax=Salinarimonas sp. TaxID=2766526 RepID=UPI0032D929D6